MIPVELMVAVSGTLSGSLLTGWMHNRNNKAQREEVTLRARQDKAINAVVDLKCALDRHRVTMWKVYNDFHNGTPQPDGVDQTHDTRSAISAPLAHVELLDVERLTAAARAAVKAVFVMIESTDAEHLDTLRVAARDAADNFIAEAADQFTLLGLGLCLPARGKARRMLGTASRWAWGRLRRVSSEQQLQQPASSC
jgi:hypothetical protein